MMKTQIRCMKFLILRVVMLVLQMRVRCLSRQKVLETFKILVYNAPSESQCWCKYGSS